MSTAATTSSCRPSEVRNDTPLLPEPQMTAVCPRSFISAKRARHQDSCASNSAGNFATQAASSTRSASVVSFPAPLSRVSAAIVRYCPAYSKPMAAGKKPAALNRCSSECGEKYEQCS